MKYNAIKQNKNQFQKILSKNKKKQGDWWTSESFIKSLFSSTEIAPKPYSCIWFSEQTKKKMIFKKILANLTVKNNLH